MKYRFPAYYRQFICTGAECEDTCCGGWKIEIDEKSSQIYNKVRGAMGRRLSLGIDHKNKCFLTDGGKCVFLNQSGWCDIYRELGRSGMCRTCRDYPRHMEDYGEVREVMLSLSCPEAARMILEDERQGAWIEKNRDGGQETEQEDREFRKVLEDVRHTMVCILRDRSICLDQRLAMILSFAHDIQKRIGERRFGEFAVLTGRYLAPGAAARFAGRMKPYQNRERERRIRVAGMVRDLGELEPVLEGWEREQQKLCSRLYHRIDPEAYEKLAAAFAGEASGLELEWENLVLYFLFTYLLGAVYDGKVYGKVKFALYSFLMIRENCLETYQKENVLTRETLVNAAYRYSREVENSDANLEHLERLFETSGLYGTESMMTVLLGKN